MLKKSLVHLRLLSLTVAAGFLTPGKSAEIPGNALRNADPNTMHFVLAGDSIINRRLSVSRVEGFENLLGKIRGADAAFTNFETVIHDFTSPGEALSGGTYMGSPDWVGDELKWAGFSMVGLANNHTFDWGVDGMRSTRKALAATGLMAAGTGENLARARAPGYLETPKGRIALISCASTFPPASAAGQQRKDVPGRPGLNPLRYTVTYTLDEPTFTAMQSVYSLSLPANSPERRSLSLKIADARFERGNKNVLHTAASPADLAEIVASVRDARAEADWVVVSIHCHEGAPGNREMPPDFLVEFAHAVIDAGADMMVSHGPHLVRGIEIFHERPIFYSMGDFIFENETVRFQPTENYESVGLPPSALPSDFFSARSKNDTTSFPADRQFWESILAEPVFDLSRHLQSLRIYPIELGFGLTRQQRGRPRPASEEKAREIVERLSRLSLPFGTTVKFENGIGVAAWKNN